jgi:hypothetical protein
MFIEVIYKQMAEANPPAPARNRNQNRNQPRGNE